MSHFHGTLRGNRGEVSRCGTVNSGLKTEAAGWRGKIVVYLTQVNGRDEYDVYLHPHMGSGGIARMLASGVLNAREQPCTHCHRDGSCIVCNGTGSYEATP